MLSSKIFVVIWIIQDDIEMVIEIEKKIYLIAFVLETKKILPPEDYYPDERFNHIQQICERLTFLK